MSKRAVKRVQRILRVMAYLSLSALCCLAPDAFSQVRKEYVLPRAEDKPVFVKLLAAEWTSLKGQAGRVFSSGDLFEGPSDMTTGFRLAESKVEFTRRFTKAELEAILREKVMEARSGDDDRRGRQELSGLLKWGWTPGQRELPAAQLRDLGNAEALDGERKEAVIQGLTPLLPDSLEMTAVLTVRGAGIFACAKEGPVPYDGFGAEWRGRIDHERSEFVATYTAVYPDRRFQFSPEKSYIYEVNLANTGRAREVVLGNLSFYRLAPEKFFDPVWGGIKFEDRLPRPDGRPPIILRPFAGAVDGTLLFAAKKGDTTKVRALVSLGADVNARDERGMTALSLAAFNGDADTLHVLLEWGADPGAGDQTGMTPLMWAVRRNQLAAVRTLLAAGANINAKGGDGSTALILAGYTGSMEVVGLLLAHGGDVNARNMSGVTALMGAARFGRADVVSLLLAHGANVNLRNTNGETALKLAADNRHTAVAELLTKAGATHTDK